MEYLYAPFIDSWDAPLSLVGVWVDYSSTDRNYKKSQNILRVHHLSIAIVSRYFASCFPFVFSLLLVSSFSFTGLERLSRQYWISQITSYWSRQKKSISRICWERERSLRLICIQWEQDRSESILKRKERKVKLYFDFSIQFFLSS